MGLPFLRKIVFILSFLILPGSHVNAQLTDSIKMVLEKASAKLYAQGYSEYVVIDGILDGFLAINESYLVSYKNDQFVFNDKKLPKRVNRIYKSKLDKMFALHTGNNETYTHQFSKFGNSRLDNLLSPQHGPSDAQQMKHMQEIQEKITLKFQSAYDTLVKTLKKDGLIERPNNYKIIYNEHGLSINDELIRSDLQEKYTNLMDSYKIGPKEGFKFNADLKNAK